LTDLVLVFLKTLIVIVNVCVQIKLNAFTVPPRMHAFTVPLRMHALAIRPRMQALTIPSHMYVFKLAYCSNTPLCLLQFKGRTNDRYEFFTRVGEQCVGRVMFTVLTGKVGAVVERVHYGTMDYRIIMKM